VATLRPKPIIGPYEKPFWDHVQKRELRLQRCSNGHFRYPPGPCCPKCMSLEYSWDKVTGRGKLISWTVFHRKYFPDLAPPYTVVCGSLDEGPLLVANFVGDDSKKLELDMPLQLAFEDARTKDGDFVIYQWSAVR
jgi:uncharacterized OB-fold protein